MNLDIYGHSLGGARAQLAAAMLVDDGETIAVQVITCGSPAPGTFLLNRVLNRGVVAQRDYHNVGDPVWEVPSQPPFSHRFPAIGINQPGPGDIFTNHKIALYQAGTPANDRAAVDLIAALYNPQPGDFDLIQETHGVVWGLKRQGPLGRPAIVFRGSVTDEDWVRDFFAIPIFVPAYIRLGIVHAGFVIGMHQTVKAIKAALAA